MPKETWIVAAVLTSLVLLGMAGLSGCNKRQALETLQAELARTEAAAVQASNRLATVETEIEQLRQRAAELEAEKERATQAQRTLEQEMRARLESKDITISELQGRLTVNILDRVLFDSGEAVLREEGERVLLQVASVLKDYPARQIHVVGHTDNVPIRAGPQARFASNWELSSARAIAAVRFLQEKAGVDPRRLGALGYGEHRPVADNATAEGRARNRRIAIVVLSDAVLGTEEPPPAVTPTPSPPANAPAPVPAATVPPEPGGKTQD